MCITVRTKDALASLRTPTFSPHLSAKDTPATAWSHIVGVQHPVQRIIPLATTHHVQPPFPNRNILHTTVILKLPTIDEQTHVVGQGSDSAWQSFYAALPTPVCEHTAYERHRTVWPRHKTHHTRHCPPRKPLRPLKFPTSRSCAPVSGIRNAIRGSASAHAEITLHNLPFFP